MQAEAQECAEIAVADTPADIVAVAVEAVAVAVADIVAVAVEAVSDAVADIVAVAVEDVAVVADMVAGYMDKGQDTVVAVQSAPAVSCKPAVASASRPVFFGNLSASYQVASASLFPFVPVLSAFS